MPTLRELEEHKKIVPEIDPASVVAMLEIRQAGEQVAEQILDVLQRDYHLSEGKFCVLIVLHQHPEGIAPSQLAARVGVARATISTMLQRLEKSGDVVIEEDAEDRRGKRVRLTAKGRAFMAEVLPPHYLRVTKLMEKLTQEEQEELIRLLRKLAGE
ncbi:MarR family winged helix-turn-helix transcriptional regulator [Selenomonas sp.]|nr:MarR family transcriptional regulator [Selenomonas sp.]MDY3298690.1 MarR family transcriptional regulator [Selenomonas sp.]